MLSFRKKIFLSYLLVFLVFIALMFPFSEWLVKQIVHKAMADRATEVIVKLQSASNNESLVRRLRDQKHQIFFRVSIITDDKKILYDSHTTRLLGPRFSQEYVIEHPEVITAFEHGIGFHSDYSDLLGQKFLYMGKAFDFHGKTYVMRTAVPYAYVADMTYDSEIGFLVLATVVLFFFSSMTWFILNHLTSPIQLIINAIKPYQEGKVDEIPEITTPSSNPQNDFNQLASTLDSLSKRIRSQIATLVHERNEKEAILESLIEGVVAVDEHMIVTYANNMALKIFDLEKKDLLGKHFAATNQSKCHDLLVACQHQGQPLNDTLQIKQDAKKIYLDLVAAPTEGEQQGAVLVMQDQTVHYKMMEMRKDFVANASHELKTPITIIRGFAETLHDNPQLPEKTLVDVTAKIVRNCERMANLIKNLLTLADVENLPHSRLLKCDLYSILQQCRQQLLGVFPDAQVRIEKKAGEKFRIIGDPELLELAFMNLINNAAKYSQPPAQITVSLQATDEFIKVLIADKGIGIPAADIEHVFQRFYTVDKAHSRKMGGSGLGLSIVQTIIEKHLGTISLESNLGQGTTFTIELPTHMVELI